MTPSTTWRAFGAVLLFALAASARAATIVIVNDDGPGEGFNDPTAASPVGGNSATTLGAQRLAAFQFAASLWGAELVSGVTIRVGANMDPLECDGSSAVLGQAGPNTVHADFTGAPIANTWYPAPLANKLAASDLSGAQDDISATFNSAIGTTCAFPNVWYYGLDANPPGGEIDFIAVVLHEIGHGLGFLTFVDESTGALFIGRNDTYMRNLEDHSTGLLWPAMTNGQRAASAIDTNDLHWVGAAVTANSGGLSAGKHASGHVQMYAPNPLQPGSSVSHFSTACSPNELMEPMYTGPLHGVSLARHLMTDIGWGSEGGTTTTSTPGSSSSTTSTTIPAGVPCPPAPIASCGAAASQRATLLLRNAGAKRTLRWKIVHGAGGDLDDPIAGTPLVRLCLYDASAAPQPLALLLAPPGGTCGTKPCWKRLGATGYRYRDPTGTPDGLTDMKLKIAPTGELQFLAKGKGASLALPSLPLVAPVTAQLAIGEGAGLSCWQALFTSTQKNDAVTFKAKSP